MPLTYDQIKELVAYGGGMDISARRFSFEQLKELAAYAGHRDEIKPTLRIVDADALDFNQLKDVAAHGKGSIFFVF